MCNKGWLATIITFKFYFVDLMNYRYCVMFQDIKDKWNIVYYYFNSSTRDNRVLESKAMDMLLWDWITFERINKAKKHWLFLVM